MGSKKITATSTTGSLSVDTILHATLRDTGTVESVLQAFEPYIVEESTIHKGTPRAYVDEDLAQALRAALLERIPEFRFKVG